MYASAGGGGGGHSGGDGSGGGDGGAIIYLVYWLFRLVFGLPFPINIIVFAIIIFVIYKVSKTYQANSGLNDIPGFNSNASTAYSSSLKQDKIPADFLVKNPDFETAKFKEKVRTAFMDIQQAWMQQDLSKVRKWISDGVYQRFHTQFMMMKQLQQVNEISNIQIQQIFIDDVESDGN